jgi:hypothetical protein
MTVGFNYWCTPSWSRARFSLFAQTGFFSAASAWFPLCQRSAAPFWILPELRSSSVYWVWFPLPCIAQILCMSGVFLRWLRKLVGLRVEALDPWAEVRLAFPLGPRGRGSVSADGFRPSPALVAQRPASVSIQCAQLRFCYRRFHSLLLGSFEAFMFQSSCCSVWFITELFFDVVRKVVLFLSHRSRFEFLPFLIALFMDMLTRCLIKYV